MKTIKLKELFGTEVLSRASIRRIYDFVDDETTSIDMSGIQFISRSVADELCNVTDEFNKLILTNMLDKVSKMISIVSKGRKAGHQFYSRNSLSITVTCSNMEDLRKALSLEL